MKTQMPPNFAVLPCSILLLAIAISCSSLDGNEHDDLANQEDIYTGIYLQGIEDVWFKPCVKSDEVWNPKFTQEMVQTIMPLLSGNWRANHYLTVKGIPTKKGEYKGFFARYDREIEVSEILEIQMTDSDDCP